MTGPLVDPIELGSYLDDDDIDEDRARLMLQLAQGLCESLCSPLPAEAAGIVMRVAGRAYVSVLSPRKRQQAQAGSPYGGVETGEVRLWREDRQDLMRFARISRNDVGSGGVFSVDMLPAGYVPPRTATHGSYDGFDGDWYGTT